MSHADPIADMLTRIRNALSVKHPEVIIRGSRICEGIAQVLREEGYITEFDRIPTPQKQDLLRVTLKYGPAGEQVIHNITRVSKTSRRVYSSMKDLPKVMGGLGIGIVSTSKGIFSDGKCRQLNVGGELLCSVS